MNPFIKILFVDNFKIKLQDLEYRKRLEKDAEAIFNIAMQHLPTDLDKSAE